MEDGVISDQNCELCGKKLTVWNHAIGIKKCSQCVGADKQEVKRMLEASPWPSKGVLWWAALIVFEMLHEILPVLLPDLQYRFDSFGIDVCKITLLFLGGAMSLAVCAWWFAVSKRQRESSFPLALVLKPFRALRRGLRPVANALKILTTARN